MTKFCYFLTGLMQTRMNVRCLFVIISVSACVSGCTGQRSLLSAQPAPQRIVQVEGATLDRILLQKDNVVYVQTIDLQKMAIEQLTGEIDRRKGVKGLYYPDKRPESSPFFIRLPATTVLQNYQKLQGKKLFSVVNASFFEDYERSTRLSFPIKINGKVITAGSSPYGPIEEPADPYYRSIQLKALTWKENQVSVIDYNPMLTMDLYPMPIKITQPMY
jgi:hypothetical protein